MSKRIAVVLSGAPAGQELKDLTLDPGTTPADVFAALGLPSTGYLLTQEGSTQPFALEEGLYERVNDGTKLRVTSVADVGNLFKMLAKLLRTQPGPVTVTIPRRPIVTGNGIHVTANRTPLWQLRGWIRKGPKLTGAYRVPGRGAVAGEIEPDGRYPNFYVINPPQALLTGPHGPCFRPRGAGRYWVHFSNTASGDLDSMLVAVERLIADALRKEVARV